MDDDELRARLAGLLSAAGPVRVPPMSVIRRRMRRRQARQATTGVLACACAAVCAVLIRGAVGAPPPEGPANAVAPASVPDCTGKHISVAWVRAFPIRGVFMEAPPETFLLGFRNTGGTACALIGWPRLVMTRPPHQVSITYGTRSTVVLPPKGKRSISRVVKPTRVLLRPGATAVSAVTVALPLMWSECMHTAWAVTPPVPSVAHILPGGPRFTCAHTSVAVSPVYPASVPISQNYPRPAHSTSPAAAQPPAAARWRGPATAT